MCFESYGNLATPAIISNVIQAIGRTNDNIWIFASNRAV